LARTGRRDQKTLGRGVDRLLMVDTINRKPVVNNRAMTGLSFSERASESRRMLRADATAGKRLLPEQFR